MAINSDQTTSRDNEAGRQSGILEGNPIPTFVIDATCKITHWNRACHLLTGIGAAETIGTDRHRDVFYAERREVLADLIVRGASNTVLKNHYQGKYRNSTLLRDGYEGEDFFPNLGQHGKWLFFTAAPVKDANGNMIGAIETLQDITDLRLAEKALSARDTHYRHLFECANDAILILKKGAVSLCNQKAMRLFMRSRKEMTGLTPLMLSPEIQPDGALSKNAIEKKRAIVLQDVPIVFEWRFLKKDGSPFDTEVSLTRFNVEEDPQAIAIVRDISERKNLIQALEDRKKELDDKSCYLEKVNLALKAALDHREIEKRAVEEHLLINLKRLVFPYLYALNKCRLGTDAQAYLNIIDTNLKDIVSRLSTTVFAKYLDFTPAEIRIADLIREGRNTKDIASFLSLSPSSVKWHRKNIRKKLGLTNNPMNLYTYLNSLSE